jgi:hypothetical protein
LQQIAAGQLQQLLQGRGVGTHAARRLVQQFSGQGQIAGFQKMDGLGRAKIQIMDLPGHGGRKMQFCLALDQRLVAAVHQADGLLQ